MMLRIAAFATAALLSANAALATQTGSIVVKTVAEQEQTVVVDGKPQTLLVPATLVVPGGEVVYTVTFQNVGRQAATDVAVVNPVPEHTRLVADSAVGPGTEVTYSVDGGRSFAAADRLTVRAADGTERPATAEDYTHLRWVLKNPLPPGAVAFARYRTVVR